MADSVNTESNLILKDYSDYGIRKLNKILRLREKQIAATESGKPTTEKRLAQLKYERDTIMTTLMERAMTK